MAKKPPIHELDFLKAASNHLEFDRKLASLACSFPDLKEYATHVSKAWFNLGVDHLDEAKKIVAAGCLRAAYSRAYYAAYNVSNGLRYMVQGYVSLKGDDHGKAGVDLPGDFPDVAQWSRKINELYQHRLTADYDNWDSTRSEFEITPGRAILNAELFIEEAEKYLKQKWVP